MGRGRQLIGGLVAVLALLLAAAPSGASVKFGDNLQTDPGTTTFNCNNDEPCTDFLSNLDASRQAPGGFVSPMDGVVVGFTIRVGSFTTPVVFRLVRPSGLPGYYTGGGTAGAAVTPPINMTTSYPVRLATKIGDRVGIDCCQGGGDAFFYAVPAGQGSHSYWNSLSPPLVLADGGPERSPYTNDGYALALQATVEADADQDGFGDETQDECVGVPGTNNGCPPPASPTTTKAATKCTRKKPGTGKKKAKKRSAAESKKKRCKRKHRK